MSGLNQPEPIRPAEDVFDQRLGDRVQDLSKIIEVHLAAKRCDFETMKDLEKNPCTGLNFQQESGGIVWTALDWVIEHNNRSMVSEWAEKGASSFKCYGQEFKSHFEEIEQKYKGRESCCFWNAANTANFQDMKDRFESTKGAIDVNWIKSKNTVLMTSLDCAYEQNDEAMAKYLLEKGAKLCSTTPEQFYFSFPALRN